MSEKNNFFTEVLRLLVASDLAIVQFEREGSGFKFQVLETSNFDYMVDAQAVSLNEKDFGKVSLQLFKIDDPKTPETAAKTIKEFVNRVIFVNGIVGVDIEDLMKFDSDHLAKIYAMSRAPETTASTTPKTKVALPAAIRN